MYDLIIIGGGPSGIFAAIHAKNKNKTAKIAVLEKTQAILAKLKVSGGGKCNITNAAFDPKDLCLNYPRGNKELLEAFYRFGPRDMIKWLKDFGISVKFDKDKKAFPSTDSSQTIIDCLIKEIKNKKIEIFYAQNIVKILKKNDFFELYKDNQEIIKSKNLIIATGSGDRGLAYAEMLGHTTQPFIPSLFSFKISSQITKLAGISKEGVSASIKNTYFSYSGSILITHEGFSGPAIINLSSLAAKYLHENNYKTPLLINWLYKFSKEELQTTLFNLQNKYPKKTLLSFNPFNFSKNLWAFLLQKNGFFLMPIQNISKKSIAMLIDNLTKDEYQIISKSQNKSEFVACGGINLNEINFKNMQSKKCENLYFAGELLNVDGITGGFNLQNAWTTGYIAGNSIQF